MNYSYVCVSGPEVRVMANFLHKNAKLAHIYTQRLTYILVHMCINVYTYT